MAVGVDAAHQGRVVVRPGDLADGGGDVADGEADAALGDGLGSEPWISRTWCSDISPAGSSSIAAWRSSTSTMISCPRLSRFSALKVSWCGTCSSLWVPGITRMAPFAAVLSVSATQAVTTSAGSRPQ